MISSAIIVVALVIVALATTIVVDILTGGRVPALGLLRQWQGLVGTMLGFITGAGILAISAAIQNQADQVRKTEELRQVGEALLVEAGTLDKVLERAEGLRSVFESAKGVCPSPVLELAASFHHEIPMFEAAVPHFVAVGAPNLSLFVEFYGTYGELERNLTSYVGHGCPPVGPDTEALIFDKMLTARKAFGAIEAQYRNAVAQ